MEIKSVQSENFNAVKRITRNTISEIYLHYYAEGVVNFFLAHHNDESIMKDIIAGNVYLIFDGVEAAGTVTDKKE